MTDQFSFKTLLPTGLELSSPYMIFWFFSKTSWILCLIFHYYIFSLLVELGTTLSEIILALLGQIIYHNDFQISFYQKVSGFWTAHAYLGTKQGEDCPHMKLPSGPQCFQININIKREGTLWFKKEQQSLPCPPKTWAYRKFSPGLIISHLSSGPVYRKSSCALLCSHWPARSCDAPECCGLWNLAL